MRKVGVQSTDQMLQACPKGSHECVTITRSPLALYVACNRTVPATEQAAAGGRPNLLDSARPVRLVEGDKAIAFHVVDKLAAHRREIFVGKSSIGHQPQHVSAPRKRPVAGTLVVDREGHQCLGQQGRKRQPASSRLRAPFRAPILSVPAGDPRVGSSVLRRVVGSLELEWATNLASAALRAVTR